MTNSLRKSLRIWLEGLTKAQTELESLNTKENQETLLRYPIIEGDWRHPQSHILERTLYFIDQTRKCAQKMISALPAERKTKVVKFVEPKPSKEKSLDEQAKSTRKKVQPAKTKVPKEAGAGQKNRKSRKAPPEVRDSSGISGGGTKPAETGVSGQIRRVRKQRSDKGKSRSKE